MTTEIGTYFLHLQVGPFQPSQAVYRQSLMKSGNVQPALTPRPVSTTGNQQLPEQYGNSTSAARPAPVAQKKEVTDAELLDALYVFYSVAGITAVLMFIMCLLVIGSLVITVPLCFLIAMTTGFISFLAMCCVRN